MSVSFALVATTWSLAALAKAPNVCHLDTGARSRTILVVDESGHVAGENLDIGVVDLTSGKSVRQFWVFSDKKTELQTYPLSSRTSSFGLGSDLIPCGQRKAERLTIDFGGSSLPPGPFSEKVSVFSQVSGGASNAAALESITGILRRKWIDVEWQSGAQATTGDLVIKNSGDLEVAIGATREIRDFPLQKNTDLCSGRMLQPKESCRISFTRSGQAPKSPWAADWTFDYGGDIDAIVVWTLRDGKIDAYLKRY